MEQKVELILVPGPNDPPENHPVFQKELREFGQSLCDADIKFSQRARSFDAVDGSGYSLPEFVLSVLDTRAISVVVLVIGNWVTAKANRKVRLKMRNKDTEIELEANTPDDLKRIREEAATFINHKVES